MSIKAGSLARVITNYQAPFPDPIRTKAGEIVTIDPEKKTDIPGWIWCTSRAGKSGWVPEVYVDRQGNTGSMRCNYDAVELTIYIGDILTVHKMESAFYWVTDRNGRQGWVPAAHIEPYPPGQETEAK
jgi:uncharacterized protein YgiM (DUF1202 family)